jgi:hypothetical protein
MSTISAMSTMSTMSAMHVPNVNKLSWRTQKLERNYLRFYDNKIVTIEAISVVISINKYLKEYVITGMGLENLSLEELRNARNTISRFCSILFQKWADCWRINDTFVLENSIQCEQKAVLPVHLFIDI